MHVILFSVFWCLVAVHSQTEYPYVSFMGVNLTNHSYVDLTAVGENKSASGNTLRCNTNLITCCSNEEGEHRGGWCSPDGQRLSFFTSSDDIVMDRELQVVHLVRRNNATIPSGIYRCDIETVAFHHGFIGETVYVGLYPPSEGNIISASMLILVIKMNRHLFLLKSFLILNFCVCINSSSFNQNNNTTI